MSHQSASAANAAIEPAIPTSVVLKVVSSVLAEPVSALGEKIKRKFTAQRALVVGPGNVGKATLYWFLNSCSVESKDFGEPTKKHEPMSNYVKLSIKPNSHPSITLNTVRISGLVSSTMQADLITKYPPETIVKY
jgi:hypothetical protein